MLLAIVGAIYPASAIAQTETAIYDFSPVENLGFPNLVADTAGNLYGAYYSTDTVFELSRQGSGWTYSVIATVPGSVLSLAIDKNGNIFGTTLSGGFNGNFCAAGCGTVFELSPPAQAGGSWTQTILYQFLHGERGPTLPHPTGITIGAGGVLYGALQSGGDSAGDGLVFRLRPPTVSGGSWAYAVLYGFQGGNDGQYPSGFFAIDKNQNLYGTTRAGGTFNSNCFLDCGTVFRLSAPSSPGGLWNKTTIFTFAGPPVDGYLPNAGLLLDKAGNLYGSTGAGNGTVFELTPPAQSGGAWTETILHSFTNSPDGSGPLGLAAGPSGSFFGATFYGGSGGGTSGGGTVFQLTPPAQAGGAWTETILYNFLPIGDSSPNGIEPNSNVIYKSGSIFGATTLGGSDVQPCSPTGCGVIYQVRP